MRKYFVLLGDFSSVAPLDKSKTVTSLTLSDQGFKILKLWQALAIQLLRVSPVLMGTIGFHNPQ